MIIGSSVPGGRFSGPIRAAIQLMMVAVLMVSLPASIAARCDPLP
jgi:hypothetical protein